MTTVLIPSNFEQDTLDCIPELIETFPNLELNVLLFHAFSLSSSITDLLMLSRPDQKEQFVSKKFWKGCFQREQELETIKQVKISCFYGTTLVAFRNFLEANQVDFIACPANFSYRHIDKQSQDPFPFLDKCHLPVISVAPRVPLHASELDWV